LANGLGCWYAAVYCHPILMGAPTKPAHTGADRMAAQRMVRKAAS
jgi:hypothetical protein